VRRIPLWALASSALAPVLLIGGWTLAAAVQPPGYDPIRDTISALAALGTPHRLTMTAALVGLGVCHMVTAAGLRPARRAGRVILACGGLATCLVAAFPQPHRGNSVAHSVAAALAFAALALWPLLAMHANATVPLLSRRASVVAAFALVGLVLWFVLELHGDRRGLAERAAAGAQSLWPLAVVLSAPGTAVRRGWRNRGGAAATRRTPG
jgi:hypothetical membrane protein